MSSAEQSDSAIGPSDFDIFFINSIYFMIFLFGFEILRLVYKKCSLKILNGVEEMYIVHMLRARLLLYFRIGRLGRVYSISTHVLKHLVWSGDVPAGTVDTPPQVTHQTLRQQAQKWSHVGSWMCRRG
jgi:hypothetical protein